MRTAFIILISCLSIASCKKNSGCTEFGSENYDPDAAINDGSCIAVNEKFIGSFQVSSNCFVDDYSRQITATANKQIVIISNLADTLGSVEAQVAGSDITIEQQMISSLVTIEGAGTYVMENDAISLSFRVRDNRTGSEEITDCLEWCSKL